MGDEDIAVKRRDGLIIRTDGMRFTIEPVGGSEPVTTCPCCRRPFTSLTTAFAAADKLFPLKSLEDEPPAA